MRNHSFLLAIRFVSHPAPGHIFNTFQSAYRERRRVGCQLQILYFFSGFFSVSTAPYIVSIMMPVIL